MLYHLVGEIETGKPAPRRFCVPGQMKIWVTPFWRA